MKEYTTTEGISKKDRLHNLPTDRICLMVLRISNTLARIYFAIQQIGSFLLWNISIFLQCHTSCTVWQKTYFQLSHFLHLFGGPCRLVIIQSFVDLIFQKGSHFGNKICQISFTPVQSWSDCMHRCFHAVTTFGACRCIPNRTFPQQTTCLQYVMSQQP